MRIRTFILLSTLLLSLSLSAQTHTMRSTSLLLNEPTVSATQTMGYSSQTTGTSSTPTTAAGFRAISTVPTIGMDGHAVQPGMNMATLDNESSGFGPFNPDIEPDDNPNGYPIGDAVLPLLLFSAVYAIFLARKHRKNMEKI